MVRVFSGKTIKKTNDLRSRTAAHIHNLELQMAWVGNLPVAVLAHVGRCDTNGDLSGLVR